MFEICVPKRAIELDADFEQYLALRLASIVEGHGTAVFLRKPEKENCHSWQVGRNNDWWMDRWADTDTMQAGGRDFPAGCYVYRVSSRYHIEDHDYMKMLRKVFVRVIGSPLSRVNGDEYPLIMTDDSDSLERIADCLPHSPE